MAGGAELPVPTSGAAAATLGALTAVAGGEPSGETAIVGVVQWLRGRHGRRSRCSYRGTGPRSRPSVAGSGCAGAPPRPASAPSPRARRSAANGRSRCGRARTGRAAGTRTSRADPAHGDARSQLTARRVDRVHLRVERPETHSTVPSADTPPMSGLPCGMVHCRRRARSDVDSDTVPSSRFVTYRPSSRGWGRARARPPGGKKPVTRSVTVDCKRRCSPCRRRRTPGPTGEPHVLRLRLAGRSIRPTTASRCDVDLDDLLENSQLATRYVPSAEKSR